LIKSKIIFKSIWKFYGEISVLKDITYVFESGNIYILKGENGAGKTSLLSVFSGLSNFQEGKLEFLKNGLILNYENLRNAEICSAFPLYGCYDFLSIQENLTYATPLCPRAEQKRVIDEIIDLFNLDSYRDTKYSELSKGFQQRTSLAVAFINRPLWIVLDEPSVYLDQDSLEQLILNIKLFKNLGTSFFISTHESRIIDSFNSKILTISQGELN
jgi:ABC-type multidrug transport system ATPase subunit